MQTSSCPLPVIGILRTGRATTEATPVQAGLNRTEEGAFEVGEQFVAGLAGLVGPAGFDYAWLLTWLGDSAFADENEPPLTQVPFLLRPSGRTMGVFATRSPRRINPIGLSLVRLLGVDGRTVRFAGVDMIDGTPVIDLKPYVTTFDRPAGEPRCGWFDEIDLVDGITPADLG
jgi:tRNA-Thr(GGU) m(6)t(6)A37 methyltransferase TsaA